MMTAVRTAFDGVRRWAQGAATRAVLGARSLTWLVSASRNQPAGEAARESASSDATTPDATTRAAGPRRDLPPAALRALAEAEARRVAAAEAARNAPPRPVEYGGRKGPDPTRYGDWENNGIASDF